MCCPMWLPGYTCHLVRTSQMIQEGCHHLSGSSDTDLKPCPIFDCEADTELSTAELTRQSGLKVTQQLLWCLNHNRNICSWNRFIFSPGFILIHLQFVCKHSPPLWEMRGSDDNNFKKLNFYQTAQCHMLQYHENLQTPKMVASDIG
jgi:hypothetical protein